MTDPQDSRTPQVAQQELEAFRKSFRAMREEVGRVIVGQDRVVEGTLMALIAGGHVLLEGVPGLGKTLLVRTLADALHLSFKRVQFTPDLMPADLIGTNVVLSEDGGGRQFRFQPGPLFAHIVLADEINRATPKTQSALLESMQERSVTVGGETHILPNPYFVLATQNPLEMEGTYPLPEAQLDRFFFKILVPYPTEAELEGILERTTEASQAQAERLFEGETVLSMGRLAREIPIADEIRRYAVRVILATHPDREEAPDEVRQYVRYGSSPRGAQALILAAKIRAILDGRCHVARDDIDDVTLEALRHRILLNFEGQAEGVRPDDILKAILRSTAQTESSAA